MNFSLPPALAVVAIALSVSAFVSTSIGGVLALRFRNRLPLIMGFTAGVLIGIVCFELLPELVRLIGQNGISPRTTMSSVACGMLIFHALEKFVVVHHHDECANWEHRHPRVGVLSALALAGHSAMDGIGIGLGFQVSRSVGALVALAVIAHDFVDGMNTVIVMIANRNTTRQTLPYLILDALAPVFGVLCTFFFRLPASALTLYLGFFAGFLLYIGASHILPEAHRGKSSLWTLTLTMLGALFSLVISLIA